MPTLEPYKGFRLTLKADVVTVAIASVATCAVTLMLLVHYRPAPKVEPACQVKEPSIDITQTFFIPVPKVIVKIVKVPVPTPPEVVPPPPDKQVVPEKKQEQPDPVFEHREPIITSALRHPIQR